MQKGKDADVVNYCALCGVKHDTGECCGGPKDIDGAREFFLDVIDVLSSGDERFALEAEVFKVFILEVEPDKIPAIYHDLVVGLVESFEKVDGGEESADIVQRLIKDRFN